MKKIFGYIGNYDEAILIVHTVRLGLFETMTRRLNNEERDGIESGDIFCFIENDHGMRRWTDGRVWSPSKISGEFLIYQEVPRHLSKNSLKKRRDPSNLENDGASPSTELKKEEIIDNTTLHKKTVSIKQGDKTYHIIAYYRPIFFGTTISNSNFFKKISEAFQKYPDLRSDEYLDQQMPQEDFYEAHDIDTCIDSLSLDPGKRQQLEVIVAEVLNDLANEYRRLRHGVGQSTCSVNDV